MKNIIIVIAVLILVGGGIWFLLRPTSEEPIIPEEVITSEEEVELPKEEDEVADWQAYKNEEYGFEIKYPENVFFEEFKGPNGIKFSASEREPLTYEPHQPVFMWITSIYLPPEKKEQINTKEADLESLIKARFNLDEFRQFKMTPEESGWDVDRIKKTVFGKDNIQGYMVHSWAQASGECHYFGKRGNKSIEISRTEVGLTHEACEDDELFNKMLFTFRFLE